MDVIGAGFGRTGTLSLKAALETLGYGPCYHMNEVYADGHMERWRAGDLGVLEGFRATVDWPGCTYWGNLLAAHPHAKVILTVRSPDAWWHSFDATVGEVIRRAYRPTDKPWVAALRRFVIEVVEQRTFGRPLAELGKDDVIAVYRAHNRAVVAGVPRDRLLVHEVAEGWAPLCDFLDVDVPNMPFPAVNDRDVFHRLHNQHPATQAELASLFAGGTYSNE